MDGFIAKIHPDEISKKILNYAQEYYLQNIGFETVQFKEYYKDKIQQEAIKQKIHFPVTPLKNATTSKTIRIESLAPNINYGTILFNENMRAFNSLFETYQKGHDDSLDALEMAYRVARYKTANFKAVALAQQKLKNRFNYIKKRY